MADPVTIDDIYALFQRSQAEADRRFAEADRRFAEAQRQQAEADRRFAEAQVEAQRRQAEAQAEAQRRQAEAQAEADRRQAEADRRQAEARAERLAAAAEAERQMEELRRIVAHTSREVAGLTTRWGQFVENMVQPAVVRLFQERGIDVQETARRMISKRPGAEMEVDIFAVNGDVAVAVEVKSRLSRQDVDDVLARMGRFRQAFPHYTDYRIYGAVAAIEIDQGVDRYAYQNGLFVIRQNGDAVEIANDAAFTPNAW